MTTLKARVNGQWVPVTSSGGGGGSEVEISATDPIGANTSAELWYDTATPPALVSNDQRWNTAWGTVGYAIAPTTDQTISSTTSVPITGLSVTFTAVAGRRYKTTLSVGIGKLGTGDFFGIGINNLTARSHVMALNDYDSVSITWVEDNLSGTVTRQGVCNVSSGTGTIVNTYSRQGSIVVEDVGPATLAVSMPNPTPSWMALPLLNGWTSYDLGRVCQYRLLGDVVQVRGLAKAGTIGVIAALPQGFRTPLSNQSFSCVGDNTKIIGVEANSDGNLQINGAFAMPAYVWLDPIQFSVTP